jgi:glycosyltransferase involved in cell wall biosynthesis
MIRLIHVTTVPESLFFLRGQPHFFRTLQIDEHAVAAPGKELDRFAAEEGATVHAVPMQRRISPFADLLALARLHRCMRAIRPRIVHAHTPKGGLLGMLAAFLARVPVRIYHNHGLPFETSAGWKRWLLRTTEAVSCALAHQVLCVSHSVRRQIIAQGICRAGKVQVLGQGSINGVDAEGRFVPQPQAVRDGARERLGIPREAPVVGFVGRLVRAKGICELAQAFAGLLARWPELHLVLVGPFEEKDPVPAETLRVLRASPRVHLIGMDWNTPPLYAAMDVLAHPSFREGFPSVLLEAAAMALPVVCTRIAGSVDAVEEGVTGTLVPSGDAAALAAAIESYLLDPGLARRHGNAGRERVLHLFRPEDLWHALGETYAKLLRRADVEVPVQWSDSKAT